MKNAAMLLGLGIFLTVSCVEKEPESQVLCVEKELESQVSNVSFTPCQQNKLKSTELSSKVDVEFTGRDIQITYHDFEVTCDFSNVNVTHTFVNGFLNITQQGFPNQAKCICYTDVSYTINGISKNEVNVIFINGVQVYCYNDNELTVDEGVVINGVKWATRNVDKPGHFAINPEDAGLFYQWNRKIGWSATYPLVNSDGGTTWDDSVPVGDFWETANDPSPKGWRIPTYTELQKLLDTKNVASKWVIQNGVTGGKFIDKATGNTLFLPAAGDRLTYGTPYHAGMGCFYWSSTASGDDAYYLGFNSDEAYCFQHIHSYAFSVRSVAEGSIISN